MLHTNRRRNFMLLGSFVFIIATGLATAYWHSVKQATSDNLSDSDWLANHSEAARWAEEQKDYRRNNSSPDLCWRGDRIGFYGDKEWFLWLEEQIRNPDEFRHCGCTEYALALMANTHSESWSQWVEENGSKSQEEWIRAGFAKHNVKVNLPPTPDQTEPLLTLLSGKSWRFLYSGPQGTNAPAAIPSYVQYNAYRWLRDSGFHPLRYASTNSTVAANTNILRGLLVYSEWHTAYPGIEGEGALKLIEAHESN